MNPNNYIEYYSKEIDGLPNGRSIVCDIHPRGTSKPISCGRSCLACINGAVIYQPDSITIRNDIFINLLRLNHEPE